MGVEGRPPAGIWFVCEVGVSAAVETSHCVLVLAFFFFVGCKADREQDRRGTFVNDEAMRLAGKRARFGVWVLC